MNLKGRVVIMDAVKPLATFLVEYPAPGEPAVMRQVAVTKSGGIVSTAIDPHTCRLLLTTSGHDATEITPADLGRFREIQLRKARAEGGRLPLLDWDYVTQQWGYQGKHFAHTTLVNAIQGLPIRIGEQHSTIDITNLTR